VPGSAPSPTPLVSSSPDLPDSSPSAVVSASPTPASGVTPAPQKSGSEPYFLIPIILALVLLIALILIWRRRPRPLEGPDVVYRRVVRLASRMGYRPAPTQTVYEYTEMLAEVLPSARASLDVVAVAAVEVTYGNRRLGQERLTALATAHHAVRQALLRLMVRVPGLRGRGRSGRRGARTGR
jgi:hypothetical protein